MQYNSKETNVSEEVEQFFQKYRLIFTNLDFCLEPGPFKYNAGSLKIAVYREEIFL